MRRASAAAAALALCCLGSVLSACSGDDGDPTSTSSAPPSSGSPSDPTSTSGTPSGDPEDPPVLPEAAKHKTAAGAKAFVKYYVHLLNYAYSVPSPRGLQAVSDDTCAVCQQLRKDVASLKRRGGRQAGGAWTVKDLATVGAFSRSPTLVARIKISAGEIRETSTSQPAPIRPATVVDQFRLGWTDRWVVMDVTSL